MKIKINNIFKNKKEENISNYNTTLKENKVGRRRNKQLIENSKSKNKIELKKYFSNFFKNNNKISKSYYTLFFFMFILALRKYIFCIKGI